MINSSSPTRAEVAQAHLQKKVDLASLSPAQRRSLIATDALAALHAGKFIARAGKYVEFAPYRELSSKLDAEDFKITDKDLPSIEEAIERSGTCSVCALGACFVAEVTRNRKNRTFNEFGFAAYNGSIISFLGERGSFRETLEQYFEPQQLGLIESAFECRGDYYHRAVRRLQTTEAESEMSDADRDRLESAVKFGQRFPGSTERLEAILENIISNCGEFKP